MITKSRGQGNKARKIQMKKC